MIIAHLNEDLSEPLLIQVKPMCIETENGFQWEAIYFLYEAYWRYLYNTDKNFREDINVV